MYIYGLTVGTDEEILDMKVTKAQAQTNRAHIVETASALFRERGYDGVGIADLMAAAGFTHGGFYKHFDSKADLMAEAATCDFAKTAAITEGLDVMAFVRHYLSRKHRDAPGEGCTVAALCGDAARQSESIKTVFETGVESLLAILKRQDGAPAAGAPDDGARTKRIDVVAQMIGAIVLSRACPDDSPLVDEILDACRAATLSRLSSSADA